MHTLQIQPHLNRVKFLNRIYIVQLHLSRNTLHYKKLVTEQPTSEGNGGPP